MKRLNFDKERLFESVENMQLVHRVIWEYVARYGEKPETNLRGNCVGCAYHMYYDSFGCYGCPIVWPNGGDCYETMTGRISLYYTYLEEKDPLKKKVFAELIRDVDFVT